MDYYERTMTNHILGGREHGATGETVYFMPLAPGFHKEFEHENSCCHGTGMESHFKYADMIYAYQGEKLFVNLFVKSRLEWKEAGITIRQKTEMEAPESVILEVESKREFPMYIRIPKWSREGRKIWMDSVEQNGWTEADGYIQMDVPEGRHEIRCLFPCGFYLEKTPDRPELHTLLYGPYVLAALSGDQNFLELDLDGQKAADEVRKTGLEFQYRDLTWKPLFDIEEEAFQVYWKKK